MTMKNRRLNVIGGSQSSLSYWHKYLSSYPINRLLEIKEKQIYRRKIQVYFKSLKQELILKIGRPAM
jgi:hypothetical protein